MKLIAQDKDTHTYEEKQERQAEKKRSNKTQNTYVFMHMCVCLLYLVALHCFYYVLHCLVNTIRLTFSLEMGICRGMWAVETHINRT